MGGRRGEEDRSWRRCHVRSRGRSNRIIGQRLGKGQGAGGGSRGVEVRGRGFKAGRTQGVVKGSADFMVFKFSGGLKHADDGVINSSPSCYFSSSSFLRSFPLFFLLRLFPFPPAPLFPLTLGPPWFQPLQLCIFLDPIFQQTFFFLFFFLLLILQRNR